MSPELQAMYGLLSAEQYLRLTNAKPDRPRWNDKRRRSKAQQMYEYHAQRKAKIS